ncbi:hypothetical protein ACQCLI_12815 [Pseudomonas nitroreducens]|uniref:hypothetical protein n=1 Tax=Pseudomonas nitroreducens TaxID=46680 RepID=UPI0003708EE7|nr:hypothetical protein [Pseudomonas nitroreducens]
MPAVIAENDVSIWNDETGAIYHFPKRYSSILKPGTQVIYYKGKLLDKAFTERRLSERPHYFGVARIGSVEPDPESDKGDLLAIIDDYEPFAFAVPAKEGDSYLETIPPSMAKNYWRNGVREIGQRVFNSILSRATIKAAPSSAEGTDHLFEVITDPADIAALNAKFAKIMRKGFPYRESRELTYPSGHHTGDVFFEHDKGDRVRGWSPLGHDPAKYVNHLLFGAPGESDWLELAVQLNFPKETCSRLYAGAFVRDATGEIFLAHRGKLTKGKAGLPKDLVLSQFSNCVDARDGKQTNRVILIAGLNEPDMIDKLFAFAQEAREVATRIAAMSAEARNSGGNGAGKSGAAQRDSMMALSAYFDEFSGETNVAPPATTGKRVVEHGAIVAALAKALGSGANLQKNQAIDLAATHADWTELYEVKTSADTQSVYTAVGQLLLHGESIKARLGLPVRRFLVLPELPRNDFLKPISQALGGAVITYRKHEDSYLFSGL